MTEHMTSDGPDDARDGEDSHADAGRRVNRQFLLGGIVVALTLAVAAWLAYGVVQRSTTSPRAAGIVPDDSSGHAHRGTTSTSKPAHRATTTTAKGATTTATKNGSSAHGTTPPTGGPNVSGPEGASFSAKWSAYSTSWINECKSIWSHSTNGKLYDPEDIGSVYTVNDCTGQLAQLFLTDNVKSVPAAQQEGRTDAADFTAQLTLSGELCWVDPATDAVQGCWQGA